MQEVKIRLRFTRECLGYAKKPLGKDRGVIYCMPRSGERVMFLASWWKERLRFAAKVINRHDKVVDKIHWDAVVDGRLTEWKRYLEQETGTVKRRYALHEAFRPGTIIGINVVLPDGLTVDDFTELLSVVGTYKGISPFKSDNEAYGTFDVVSVMPTIRKHVKREQPAHEPCLNTEIRNTD